MTTIDPVPQGDDVYKPEGVTTELGRIPFNQIDDDATNFAFRDDDELTDAGIKALAEDLAVNGLTTPVLVAKRPNGRYLLINGHRRRRAILLNIKLGVAGFTDETPLAAFVIDDGASELALVARAVAANVQQRSLSADGRRKAIVRLKQLGMPNDEIARCVGVSKQTVERDLALASSGCMWDHVRNHDISAGPAAVVLKLANDVGRTADLCAAVDDVVDEANAKNEAEQKRRKEADEDPMSPSEMWPSRCFTPELIAFWKSALEKGLPLTRPEFRYRADIKKEDGIDHILIDSVDMPLAKMPARNLAKVLERLVTCVEKIKPVLKEKEQAEAARQTAQATASDAGRKVLEELGLAHLLEPVADEPPFDVEVDLSTEDDSQVGGPEVEAQPAAAEPQQADVAVHGESLAEPPQSQVTGQGEAPTAPKAEGKLDEPSATASAGATPEQPVPAADAQQPSPAADLQPELPVAPDAASQP